MRGMAISMNVMPRKRLHEFFKKYLWATISVASKSLLNLMLIKLLVVSGSSGTLGVYGQIQNLSGIGASIANLSTNSGVSAQLSAHSYSALTRALHLMVLGVVALLIVILAANFIEMPFVDRDLLIPLFVLSVILGVNALLVSALVAQGKMKELALNNIILGSLPLSYLALITQIKSTDIIYGLAAGAFASSLFSLRYVGSLIYDCWHKIHTFYQYKSLVMYGVASFFNVMALNGVLFFSRSWLEGDVNPLILDELEVLLRTPFLFEAFLISPITMLLWSAIGKAGEVNRRDAIFRNYALLVFLISSILSIIVLVFSDYYVTLIFSSALYAGVSDLLYMSLLVLVVKSVASVGILKLMYGGKIRLCILNDLMFGLVFFAVFLYFDDVGVAELMIALLVAYLSYLVIPWRTLAASGV